MRDTSVAKLGGLCSILVGLSYLAIGITFLLMPGEQQPGGTASADDFFKSVAQNSTMLVLYCWAFAVGGLAAVAAVPAISELVSSANEGWVRWTSTLAIIGYVVLAVEYLVLQDEVPRMAAGYLQSDASARAAIGVVGSLNLNSGGWIGFGTVGLWLTVVNWLALRRGQWPKVLAVLGLILGIGNGLVIAGFILGSPILILIAAGLGAIILAPIWFIWMGVRLRRAKILPLCR